MKRPYNCIYEKLVEDESDIIGHVAYSLYKSDKIKYINSHKENHDTDDLTDEELEHFHEISCLENNIERYKLEAVQILQLFLDNALSSATSQIEKDVEQRQKDILAQIIAPLKPKSKARTFWNGVLQSILGAFIFALIVAAFAFIAAYNGSDISISFK